MGRLSVSLIGVVLVGLIGLSWLFDKIYLDYHQSNTQSDQPLSEVFSALAQMANNQGNLGQWLHTWPQESQYQISIVEESQLSLPTILTTKLQKGEVLEIASQDTLQLYYLLSRHNKLLVLTQPVLDADLSINNKSRYWFTSIFYVLIIMLLLIWVTPLILRIVKLKKVAKAFGEGELTQRVNVRQGSYLADLETEFNSMAQRIEDLIGDVKLLGSAVSHELRTPLAKIRMGLDTLSEESDPIKREQYESRIQQHLDDMVGLVESLLSYARLDQVALKLSFQSIELIPMLTQICEQTRSDTHCVNLHLPASHPLISVDPVYIKVVFTNLLNNAQMHSNGQIQVSMREHSSWLDIVFSDNGPGIPEAIRKNVLKPFIRGENTSKKGYGLGLAIVKRILDWHHASLIIGVCRQLGGAEFIVRLPLNSDR